MRASPAPGHTARAAGVAAIHATIALVAALLGAPAVAHMNEAIHDAMGQIWPFSMADRPGAVADERPRQWADLRAR